MSDYGGLKKTKPLENKDKSTVKLLSAVFLDNAKSQYTRTWKVFSTKLRMNSTQHMGENLEGHVDK